MKSRPVLITFSILAALQVIAGGAALQDVIGKEVFGLFVLAVAAVQVGMTFYVQNSVVPEQDVGAFVNSSGNMVAGPAAGLDNGMPARIDPAVGAGGGGLPRQGGLRP